MDWFEFPSRIASRDSNGVTRWFEGGKLNTAWLALDRHVQAGLGDSGRLRVHHVLTSTT